jgi:hypothetical protein
MLRRLCNNTEISVHCFPLIPFRFCAVPYPVKTTTRTGTRKPASLTLGYNSDRRIKQVASNRTTKQKTHERSSLKIITHGYGLVLVLICRYLYSVVRILFHCLLSVVIRDDDLQIVCLKSSDDLYLLNMIQERCGYCS